MLVTGLAGSYGTLGNEGAAGADDEPEIMLYYGEMSPEGHVLTDSAQHFADRVSELADGKVMVKIYPSGQLEDGACCYQSMEMGALDLYRDNSMSLADNGDPMMSTLVLSYVFRDRDHLREMCSSNPGRGTLDNIQNCTGMVGLAYLGERARNFFITDRPVRRLEDMKGLKIRVQVASMVGDTMEALGAEAMPIAHAELYTTLESGTIGGAENPPANYYYNKPYRVAPYYVEDKRTYTPEVILVSRITWKDLKEEYQDALVQTAMKAQEYNRTAIEEADRKTYEALKKGEVTTLEPEDLQAWIQAMEPVCWKCGGGYLDLIEKIRRI